MYLITVLKGKLSGNTYYFIMTACLQTCGLKCYGEVRLGLVFMCMLILYIYIHDCHIMFICVIYHSIQLYNIILVAILECLFQC
jgi:hypothetical protein